jgi:hypothetical protein
MKDSLIPVAVGARHQFEDRAIMSASGVSRAVKLAGYAIEIACAVQDE